MFLLTYSTIPIVCCKNTASGVVCTVTWACQMWVSIKHSSQRSLNYIWCVYYSESRQRIKNQREKSAYAEISKLPESKPAFQSPCKIWSKLKAKDWHGWLWQPVHAYHLSEKWRWMMKGAVKVLKHQHLSYEIVGRAICIATWPMEQTSPPHHQD